MVQNISGEQLVPAIVPFLSSNAGPSQLFAKQLHELCGEVDSYLENRNISIELKLELENKKSEIAALVLEINKGKTYSEQQVKDYILLYTTTLQSISQKCGNFRNGTVVIRPLQDSANSLLRYNDANPQEFQQNLEMLDETNKGLKNFIKNVYRSYRLKAIQLLIPSEDVPLRIKNKTNELLNAPEVPWLDKLKAYIGFSEAYRGEAEQVLFKQVQENNEKIRFFMTEDPIIERYSVN